jgi:hypothetical protein
MQGLTAVRGRLDAIPGISGLSRAASHRGRGSEPIPELRKCVFAAMKPRHADRLHGISRGTSLMSGRSFGSQDRQRFWYYLEKVIRGFPRNAAFQRCCYPGAVSVSETNREIVTIYLYINAGANGRAPEDDLFQIDAAGSLWT